MSSAVDADLRPLVATPARWHSRNWGLATTGAALALLFGVLLMHSVPMVHPSGGHQMAAGSATSTTTPTVSGFSQTLETCTANCTGHGPMAMCMAVITMASALMIIRRLLKRFSGRPDLQSGIGLFGRHTSRAPPWATPTLEKLSILRI